MGLFFEVLSSINNPAQTGSVDQLSTIMNTVQQLGASHGVDSSTMQTALSTLGGLIGPALKQQGLTSGNQALGSLVGQFAGMSAGNAGSLPSFLTPQLQQQVIQTIAQTTGLDSGTLQALLPGLVSAVMSLLNMGATAPGAQGSNQILNAFLDGDRDGDTDLGDVFKFAGRFLNVPG